jgi:hypothetical protein
MNGEISQASNAHACTTQSANASAACFGKMTYRLKTVARLPRGDDRSALRQQSDGYRSGRQDRTSLAYVRPRHSCYLAYGCHKILAEARSTWRGTLMVVFQPRRGDGGRRAGHDRRRLFKHFPNPDAVLGQRAMLGPSGTPDAQVRSARRRTACRFACLVVVRTGQCPSRASPRW